MRILKYENKLVEEVGSVNGHKVVFLKYVRQEDMPRCACGRPIDEEISIVEGCKNWDDRVSGVDTLTTHNTK